MPVIRERIASQAGYGRTSVELLMENPPEAVIQLLRDEGYVVAVNSEWSTIYIDWSNA